MVGPGRPVFVLFGSSIVQFSFSNGGWGAILADVYARKADILLRGYLGWNSRRGVQVLEEVFPKGVFVSIYKSLNAATIGSSMQRFHIEPRIPSSANGIMDAAVQPSLVIVYFGGNDSMGSHSSGLGPHVPLPEYIENMRKIGTHLQSLSGKTRIIFLSSPPVNEEMVCCTQSPYITKVVRTNELCRQYSEACGKLCKEMNIKFVDMFNAIQKQDGWQTACFLTDGIHLSSEGSKILVAEIIKVLKEADWKPSLYWKSMPTEFSEDSPYDLVASNGVSTINISNLTIHREIEWD